MSLSLSKLKEALIVAETTVSALRAEIAIAEAALAVPASHGKRWGVSDNHSHWKSGDYSLEATESSSYAVAITANKPNGRKSLLLSSGETTEVSKKRYDVAKQISVGDTLYMGDEKRSIVFKGEVVSFKGIFRSIDPSANCFIRRTHEHAAARGNSPSSVSALENEVEMLWDVCWDAVCPLSEAWKSYLSFSDHSKTVRTLYGPCPLPDRTLSGSRPAASVFAAATEFMPIMLSGNRYLVIRETGHAYHRLSDGGQGEWAGLFRRTPKPHIDNSVPEPHL
jgi:hypothetical protein